jgi:hypothetical protein
MKENFEFIGREYSDDEKSQKQGALQKWSKESSEKIEGEQEKTQEDIENIELVNSFIEKELKVLGIETYDPITPDKVHILSGDVFKERFPNFDGVAQFQSLNDAIYVNKDKVDDRPLAISRILHESIHRASTRKFYADKEGGISDARVGYRIRSPWKEERSEQDKMIGFNEVINDYTVYRLLRENDEQLKSIGITWREVEGPIYNYMKYVPVLEAIAKKILKHQDNTEEFAGAEIFKKWERGQFENSILALKEIEAACGKGSLEILSYLGVLDDLEECEELDKMILEFFEEDDEDKRKEIRSKIVAFHKDALEDDQHRETTL